MLLPIHSLAQSETIEITGEATGRFHLHNGQEVKYITFHKGQQFNAQKQDNQWLIQVGNAQVIIGNRFAKAISKSLPVSRTTNKVEVVTTKPVAIYPTHNKKEKPFAMMAQNMRISSGGIKGNYYEIIVGGKKGYVHKNAVEQDNGVPILIYHHLVENQENSIHKNNVSVYDIDLFTQQADYLSTQKFYTLSLKDLDAWMKHQQALPAKAVILTFDDATLSAYELVYPLLKKYRMFATTFVIGDRVSDKTPAFDMNKNQFAGFNELREMQGVFELEHHTYGLHTFNSITKKSSLQYASNNALHYDFTHMNDVFKKIDPTLEPSYLSYPYGKYLKSHEETLIRNGISLAVLNKGGKTKINSARLYVPRVPVQASMTLKQFVHIVNN